MALLDVMALYVNTLLKGYSTNKYQIWAKHNGHNLASEL